VLEKLRIDARSTPVDRFVHSLYRQFGIMSLTVPGDQRTPAKISANLRHFYEYARSFAAHQIGGLSGFVSFINGIIESDGKIDSPGVASSGGAVSIMTIHKSKGLEFPVVFLGNCGKKFNDKPFEKPIRADADCGVGLRQTDESGLARVDTPFRIAVNVKAKKERNEEEMRLLYVALTRARERLYVVGHISSKNDLYTLRENANHLLRYEDRSSVLDAKCYLDWLLPAISQDHPSFTIVEKARADESIEPTNSESCITEDEKIESLRTILRERFDFTYHNTAAKVLPAKLSVSRLYPEILDDDGAAGLESKNLPELREKPLFMQEKTERHTAAERGTATHVFLQFCDFERARKDLRAELSRLIAERFIPQGTAELINLHQIEAFFVSDLYKAVTNAKRVWREQRFNILLPAAKFTANPILAEQLSKEKLLVQGVIDLFFIDREDNVVLCDYKTDYLTPEELRDESLTKKKLSDCHGEQLKYYATAIEQLLGRKPDRIYIYSLPFGKAINMQ
jgi:ATP-dependent helicase/nuclease subunit A